tara:strand:+ start:141 stop:599 length:459 start_codon:yes stop_codon:yes gene_type:complete
VSDSLVFLSCFFKSVGSSSSSKFFSLILTALIVLLFIFNIESANAAVTASFEEKCSWTSSNGKTFSASNCHISLGRPTVYPCVLSNYAAAIDIIFPGGAHFEIVESCSEHGSPYQVNGTAAFDCPAKIKGYRHNICLMNGEILQYHTKGGCC